MVHCSISRGLQSEIIDHVLFFLDVRDLEVIEQLEDAVGLVEVVVNYVRQSSGFGNAGPHLPMLTKNHVSIMSSIK